MGDLKEILYRELELKISINDEGISFDPLIFRHLDLGGRYQEEVICLFEMAYETHAGIKFPSCFRSPHGLIFNLRWDRRSSYSLIHEQGTYYLPITVRNSFRLTFFRGRTITTSKHLTVRACLPSRNIFRRVRF